MGWSATNSLPCTTGIGLRAPHFREVLLDRPALGWVEVHSEHYFDGGAPLHALLRVREQYPVSLHGVGMGLASSTQPDWNHLSSLRRLCDAVEPAAVSEHLSWNATPGVSTNDLLPFPYTEAALACVVIRVDQVQERLGRQLILENQSSYLSFSRSKMSEGEFLAELSRRTGCASLLDINNLYVNSRNLGVDAKSYIRSMPPDSVLEYHLAGHSVHDGYLLDTHNAKVCAEVWDLYQFALQKIGSRPTLIEWDNDIPELSVLLEEAKQARKYLEQSHACLV